MVRLHELGDSSVNFVVRPWVKTDDYWPVYWDITRAVKLAFDAQGITIPFPQRDVSATRPPALAKTTSRTRDAQLRIGQAEAPPRGLRWLRFRALTATQSLALAAFDQLVSARIFAPDSVGNISATC